MHYLGISLYSVGAFFLNMALNINNSNGELVIDPYKNKEKYQNWDKKSKGISKKNSDAILHYLEDMMKGININPKARKGKRSYVRINNQRHRLKSMIHFLERDYQIYDVLNHSKDNIKKLKDSVFDLFEKLSDGRILKSYGERYKSVDSYIKGWKAFWNWYIVYMNNEKEIDIPDINQYLTTTEDRKPKFNFIGKLGVDNSVEDGIKRLIYHSIPRYKMLIAFCYDSGIRSPTELMNVKKKDVYPMKDSKYYWLNIRDETSKTYGRRIKLMLCHELLDDFFKENKLQEDDFIFKINPSVVNRYLKRLGHKVLGIGIKEGDIIKDGLTMYDFRHNSACYWVSRYKQSPALLYRFGWKDFDMVHYYTDMLGMKDTIQDEDMMVDITKSELEKEMAQMKKREMIMEEKMKQMIEKYDFLVMNKQYKTKIQNNLRLDLRND